MEDTPVITEAPATAAANTPAADPQAQPDLVADLAANADLSQLDTLFEGKKLTLKPAPGGEGEQTPPPAAKVEATPAGEPPPAAAAEPVKADEKKDEVTETRTPEEIAALQAAEAEKVKAEVDAKTKEGEVSGIERPRLKDERDQLIAGVYMKAKREGNPISWAEAETRVDGPKVEAAKSAEAPPDYATVVGTLETEVADIKKKMDEAGASEGLYTPEIAKLTQDLTDKTSDLKLAKRDLQIATEEAQLALEETRRQSAANRDAAIAEAKRAYPDAADETTPLGKAVKDEITALRDPNHPDHALLYGDSIPFLITQKVAMKMGIAPVAPAKPASATPPPPAKPAVVQAPPRMVVSPAPGNKTAVVPGKPAEDPQKIVEYLKSDEATLEDLDAVFGGNDPSKLLAGAIR